MVIGASANNKIEEKSRGYLRHNHLRSLSEEVQTRIVNGTNSEKGRYPYYVSLMRKSGAMICGGTLIAPDVVLTAAHCFEDDLDHVILGKYFRLNRQNQSTELLPIQSTHIHPDFSYDTKRFDQMLVTLSSPSSYPYLQNVNMDGNVPSLQVNITAIGLGATQPDGTPPKVLQEGNLMVVPNDVCAELGASMPGVGSLISEDHLCLQDPNNQGAQCYGDSGGPQLILGDTPEEDLLVGVVSWGVECGTVGFPSVGSRTSASEFIRETCELSLLPPQKLCSATAEPVEAVVEVLPTNAPSFWQLPNTDFRSGFALQNYTIECATLLEPCTQNSDCCSDQCFDGFCRTSESSSSVSVSQAGNRRGAAAVHGGSAGN